MDDDTHIGVLGILFEPELASFQREQVGDLVEQVLVEKMKDAALSGFEQLAAHELRIQRVPVRLPEADHFMNDVAHGSPAVVLPALEADIVLIGPYEMDLVLVKPRGEGVEIVGNRRFRDRKHISVINELFYFRKPEQFVGKKLSSFFLVDIRNILGRQFVSEFLLACRAAGELQSFSLPAQQLQPVARQIDVLQFAKDRSSRSLQLAGQLVDRNVHFVVIEQDPQDPGQTGRKDHQAPISSLTI